MFRDLTLSIDPVTAWYVGGLIAVILAPVACMLAKFVKPKHRSIVLILLVLLAVIINIFLFLK